MIALVSAQATGSIKAVGSSSKISGDIPITAMATLNFLLTISLKLNKILLKIKL